MDPDAKLDQLGAQMMDLVQRWQKSPPTAKDDPIVDELRGYLEEVKSAVAEGEKKIDSKMQAMQAKHKAKRQAAEARAAEAKGAEAQATDAKAKAAQVGAMVPPVVIAGVGGEHVTMRYEKDHMPPTDKIQEAIQLLRSTPGVLPPSPHAPPPAIGSEKKKPPDLTEVQDLLRKMGLVK